MRWRKRRHDNRENCMLNFTTFDFHVTEKDAWLGYAACIQKQEMIWNFNWKAFRKHITLEREEKIILKWSQIDIVNVNYNGLAQGRIICEILWTYRWSFRGSIPESFSISRINIKCSRKTLYQVKSQSCHFCQMQCTLQVSYKTLTA